MKILTLSLITLLSSLPLVAQAEDSNAAKALHEEKCLNCHIKKHDDEFYTRKDRKMTSFQGLQSMVRMCDANLGTQLFDDEMEEIGKYLNDTYYKFPEK